MWNIVAIQKQNKELYVTIYRINGIIFHNLTFILGNLSSENVSIAEKERMSSGDQYDKYENKFTFKTTGLKSLNTGWSFLFST